MPKLKTPEDFDKEIARLKKQKTLAEQIIMADAGKIVHKLGLTSLPKKELAGALSEIAEKISSSEASKLRKQWADKGEKFRL